MASEQDTSGARGQLPDTHTDRIAVKPPPFWKAEPRVWFVQLEAQFNLGRITADETKYYHVVSALDSDVLTQVADVVTNPPSAGKYETIKEKLVNVFSDSNEQRLRRLLSEVELGDKRPSQLLTEMQHLGGPTFPSELLKTLWLQRLPDNVQSILAISSESLEKMASMADRIAEIVQTKTFAVSATSTTTNSDIGNIVRQLAQDVAELKLSRHRDTTRGQHTNPRRRFRSRSRTPARSAHQFYNICWYHYKFKEGARKCQPPCNFTSQPSDAMENTLPRQ